MTALFAVAAGATGCRQSATGVRIKVAYVDSDVRQIEFTLLADDGVTEVVGATVLPASPGAPLPSPQSVVVLLPDRAGTVIARARLLTTPDRQRQASADVRPHAITDVILDFSSEIDAAAPDADVDAGDAADDGARDVADARVADARAADDGARDAADARVADASDGKANGDPCGAGAECASTFCAGGRCCDTACDGTCVTCSLAGSLGTCMPIPAGAPAPAGSCTAQPASSCGNDGTCDGAGACRKHPAGTTCVPSSCAGGKVMSASTCDGKGACVPGMTIDCAPFLCDPSSIHCSSTCGSSDQCAPGANCLSGLCGLKPLGAACMNSSQCSGGATCANGVCCSSTCDRSCFLCNIPGREGLCLPVPAGAVDPKASCPDRGAASCGTNGLCDGMGACQRYPLGTVCAAQACSGKQFLSAKTCDSTGACTGAAAMNCANRFACNVDAGTCYVGTCTTDSECAQSCNMANGRCR